MSATIPMHRQEPVLLKSATTKLPNDTKMEQMTAPTNDWVVDTTFLNNTITNLANTSPR